MNFLPKSSSCLCLIFKALNHKDRVPVIRDVLDVMDVMDVRDVRDVRDVMDCGQRFLIYYGGDGSCDSARSRLT